MSTVTGSLTGKSQEPRTGSDDVNYFKNTLVWHTLLASAEAGGSLSSKASLQSKLKDRTTQRNRLERLYKKYRFVDLKFKLATVKSRQCCEMV